MVENLYGCSIGTKSPYKLNPHGPHHIYKRVFKQGLTHIYTSDIHIYTSYILRVIYIYTSYYELYYGYRYIYGYLFISYEDRYGYVRMKVRAKVSVTYTLTFLHGILSHQDPRKRRGRCESRRKRVRHAWNAIWLSSRCRMVTCHTSPG